MRLVSFLVFTTTFSFCQELRFVQNKGQWNADVDFQAQVPGGRVGVSATGFHILLLNMEELEHRHLQGHDGINESDGQPSESSVEGHYFKISLLGANPNAKATTGLPLDGYNNYYLGSDTCRWATHALAYASIVYKNVYNGIDFRVSSIGNNLKYDFIVAPEADPSQIRIEYCGVDGVEKINDALEIKTSVGTLREIKPFSYQSNSGNDKLPVASAYQLQDNIVSFSFPADYDECTTLTIDPLLIFSTYSGSSADNWGSTATPGEHGTLYSAGVTHQDLGGFFPTTTGAFQSSNRGNFDMAIIKYDSVGTRFLYATLLGGVGNDSPESLVVDKTSGDLIVLGITSSANYPASTGAFDPTFNGGTNIFNRVLNTNDQWDIVVTRFSKNGDQLVGSTFLGGSGNDGLNQPKQSGGPLVVNYGDEMRGDVITDATGNVYISSVTGSNNFPIVGGFDNSFNGGTTDGVVAKLSPDLSSIIWSSYVGGTGFDAAYSIKFDVNQNIVLAGGTTSVNFPVTAGSYQTIFNGIVDGWIMRVAADGSAIVNATFTGTASFDQVYFIDLNSSGNVYCYGQTTGRMPITAGAYNNPNSGQFLQEFSPDLSNLQLSTVFGSGSGNGLVIPNISPTAFLVNDCNNIYMAGWGGFVNSSPSTGFWQSSTFGMPVTNDAFQKTTSGSDFYFMVLNGDASQLVYSTYFGGASSKTHVDGGTSRFDKFGIVYHAVCSGCQFGNATGIATSDFPTTPNAKSRFNGSQNCNNAAFKFDLSSLRANFQTNSVKRNKPGFNNVCYPDSVVFENLSTGGRNIAWDFGDGTKINQLPEDPRFLIHQYQQTGQYKVKLKITDLSTCSQTDSITKIINYFRPNFTVGPDAIVCEGKTHQLTASGGVSYKWTSSEGTFSSTEQSPTIQPQNGGLYFVTITDGNGCSKKDTIVIAINKNVRALFQTYDVNFLRPGFNNVCYPDPIRFKNLSSNASNYVWNFADGTVLTRTKNDTASLVHGYKEEGIYRVKLKATNPITCNKADSIVKVINYYKNKVKVQDDMEICEGTSLRLSAPGGNTYSWFTADKSFTSSDPSPLVQPQNDTRYFVTITDANSCVKKDTVQIDVLNKVNLQWQYQIKSNCIGRPEVLVKNLTPAADGVSFSFSFGDGKTSEEAEVLHQYEKDSLYTVRFTAQRKFCSFQDKVQIPIFKLFVPNVFTPESTPGFNDTFKVGLGTDFIAPSAAGIKLKLVIVDRWGKNVFESDDYQNDWTANGLEGGVYFFHLKLGDFEACKDWVQVLR